MEKLGNAICLKKGLYQKTNLSKNNQGINIKLSRLNKKGKGKQTKRFLI
jgi:hypothetical protein